MALPALGFIGHPAPAATWYFDSDANAANNNLTTGAGLGGSGGWNVANSTWFDGTTDRIWDDAQGVDAVFWGTAGTVTLGSARVVKSLTFKTGNYVVTSSTLTLSGGTGIVDVQTGTATIMSRLSGNTGLTKNGTGTLVLAVNAGSFTGAINLNAGTLSIDSSTRLNDAAAGTLTISNGAVLQSTDAATGDTFLSASHGIAIGGGGGTLNLTGSNVLLYVGGSITGTGQTLTKSGPGTLRLSDTSVSPAVHTTTSFAKLVVTGGLWQGGTDGVFGAVPTSATADQITLNGGGISANASFTLNANRGISVGASGGTLNASSSFTVAGPLSGGGTLTVTGGNTVTLNNASNNANFTGAVAVNGTGTTSLSLAESLTASALTGTGTVAVSSGKTLTAGGAGTNFSFGGVVSGAGGFTKAGTGVMTLNPASGASDWTNTGAVNINQGTIKFGTSAAGFSSSSTVTIAGGATLDMNGINDTMGNVAGAGSIINGGNLSVAGSGSQTMSGTMSVATFTKTTTSTGTTTLSGDNAFGKVQVNAGTLTLSGANTVSSGVVNIVGNGTLAASSGRINFNGDDAVGSADVYVTGAGAEIANTAPNVTTTNTFHLDGTASNPVQIQSTSGNSWNITGKITGPGSLMRDNDGAGTLTLSGDNDFAGGLTITSRSLVLGHKRALGTGALTIGDAATAPATAISLSSSTNLTGANAVGNAVTVNQNFTVGGSAGFELSGPVTLVGNRTITVNNSGASGTTISGDIGGGGSLTKAGTRTLTLSGQNAYAGTTTVSAGTLIINGNHTGGGAVTVAGGATLGGSGSVNGPVTVSGTLAPGNSPGTLTVGNLTLNSGSTYAYQIDGTDDTVGGGVNDLTQVNGNLTLDGTANVSASPALDNFGFRSYRMFNYTGTLTDNGMAVGTTPSANYLYSVNTSTAGQVNLDVQQKAKIGTVSSPGAAVIKGGVTPVSILVENSSPTGSATLTFSATNLYTGLTGAGSGTAAAQATGSGTLTYDSTGAAFGVQNLGFTVTGDGATTQGGDVNGTIAVTVLDHSSASFDGAGQKTLAIDLGTVGTNAGGGTFSSFFDVFADLAPSGYTAGLDLDYVTSSGDVGTLSLAGMTSFANLAAGGQKTYGIAFDTTQNGSFSATYVFHLSDQDLAGASAAGSDVITLTVTGTVVPLPVSAWMGVGLLGGLVTVRRVRRAQVT